MCRVRWFLESPLEPFADSEQWVLGEKLAPRIVILKLMRAKDNSYLQMLEGTGLYGMNVHESGAFVTVRNPGASPLMLDDQLQYAGSELRPISLVFNDMQTKLILTIAIYTSIAFALAAPVVKTEPLGGQAVAQRSEDYY
ncbi:hypothetical protein EYR40_006274 [Pleurotus pulmonarius]|nr:hypothetical protein EYR36_010895 [Pleurotus pulmonarius]KAF4599184.1 hypothetical protein EYR40_006274 [Pleurotus pulmonarius]